MSAIHIKKSLLLSLISSSTLHNMIFYYQCELFVKQNGKTLITHKAMSLYDLQLQRTKWHSGNQTFLLASSNILVNEWEWFKMTSCTENLQLSLVGSNLWRSIFLHRLMESGTMHTVTKALCVYKCTKLRLRCSTRTLQMAHSWKCHKWFPRLQAVPAYRAPFTVGTSQVFRLTNSVGESNVFKGVDVINTPKVC